MRLRNKGASNNQASALVGFRAETGSRIWLKYQSGGWEALKPRKRGAPLGHYRALTPEQEREIKLLVRGSTPQSLNLPYSVWNRESVKRLILEKYAIDLAMRTMSLYFSRWGFAYQRKIELIDIFWPE
ncbi:MAG: winged helix-turn-helix domain-containing protein [Synergistaceae bacterium]|nr:winged helix-turn-helix domain-containing protein [Synergistaceae bacterium]